MSAKNKPLISIIMPVYNAERFLHETIKTVKKQTYNNWELIMIDDVSSDKSADIIKRYIKSDCRIKLIQQPINSGAAKARNTGINKARGRYIAFLDADDLWHPEKLSIQLKFMQDNNHAFTYTNYEFTDEHGIPNGKISRSPDKISYGTALKKSYIFTSTVVADTFVIKKEDIMMTDYKMGEDITTWWRLLSKYGEAHGINKVLSYYRRTSGSLSSNKLKAAKWRWYLYRKHENINIVKSSYYFMHYVHNAIRRRI